MTTLNATTTHALDTHYDGWLGILPKDLWDIIFKMAHQSCLQDVHSSVLDKAKDVYGHFVEEYSMKERLPRPSKYINIKLNQMDWVLQGFYIVPMSEASKLVSFLQDVKVVALRAACKENGLKRYSKLKRPELIKLLMSI